MMKLVYFHGSNSQLYLFEQKFVSHIHSPRICIILPLVKDIDADTIINTAKSAHDQMPTLFTMNKNNAPLDVLKVKFNIFHVYDDPYEFSRNSGSFGVWMDQPCEVDYLFNQVLPWLFD